MLFLFKSSFINVRLGSKYASVVCKEQRNYVMKNLKLYGPFLWMGFNSVKATVPMQGDSLYFTTKDSGGSGTYLINFDEMES